MCTIIVDTLVYSCSVKDNCSSFFLYRTDSNKLETRIKNYQDTNYASNKIVSDDDAFFLSSPLLHRKKFIMDSFIHFCCSFKVITRTRNGRYYNYDIGSNDT